MRLKLDENLPVELADDLRHAGHDVETVFGENLRGEPDPLVVRAAAREGRVLLTLDKGIGNIREYPPDQHAGVVLLRPGASGRSATAEFVRSHLLEILNVDLAGRLAVVTRRGVRIR